MEPWRSIKVQFTVITCICFHYCTVWNSDKSDVSPGCSEQGHKREWIRVIRTYGNPGSVGYLWSEVSRSDFARMSRHFSTSSESTHKNALRRQDVTGCFVKFSRAMSGTTAGSPSTTPSGHRLTDLVVVSGLYCRRPFKRARRSSRLVVSDCAAGSPHRS